jgi:carboxyl-terminal processing protease
MMRKISLYLILIGGLLTAFSFTNPGQRYFEIAKNLDIFASLFKEVNTYYVDEVNPNTLMRTGIEAMLASLDPYTNYIPEDDIEDFRTQSTGEYGGIGALTTNFDGVTKVVMIYEGYAAAKSNLKIGDEVIKINEVDIQGMTRDQTAALMKGQANTTVSLTVKRFGQPNPITIQFKREKVTIHSVPYYGLLENNIGYIKLNEFTQSASKDVRNALVNLKEKGANKIILDLRGNPGGLLVEAVNIVNLFVPRGMEVVSTRGKIEENNMVYKTMNPPIDTEIPVAVLVSSTSASASEIVAGALQDYDRAVVIGQKSFGKGLVQVPRDLSFRSKLKVTVAKYYTPSGRCIQALDYSNRNPDGSVGKIADSLKTAFNTTRGRVVYDGGGVDPDLSVDKNPISQIAQTLYRKGLIFDYATEYYYQHNQIAPANTFVLTDREYDNFIKWLNGKNYSYVTQVESQLEEIEKNARKEKYYQEIQADLQKLRIAIEKSKGNDLTLFKPQIKAMLEEEICARYYFESGPVESALSHDEDIAEALKLLNDDKRIGNLLKSG